MFILAVFLLNCFSRLILLSALLLEAHKSICSLAVPFVLSCKTCILVAWIVFGTCWIGLCSNLWISSLFFIFFRIFWFRWVIRYQQFFCWSQQLVLNFWTNRSCLFSRFPVWENKIKRTFIFIPKLFTLLYIFGYNDE